jgi:large subunit ribosomal protein L21
VTYAIIEVGGKQYRVREGERLLVDRLHLDEGASFSPAVLLLGGGDAPVLDPSGGEVTAKVVGAVKGPKIRIGKYRKRTGYRRHTGFRASLTQIEIESIGGKPSRAAAKRKQEPEAPAGPVRAADSAPAEMPAAGAEVVPEGYADMTVAEIKAAAGNWDADALRAALAYESAHAGRKGAIAALEAALARKEGES